MTTKPDTTALELQLASLTKPCPRPKGRIHNEAVAKGGCECNGTGVVALIKGSRRECACKGKPVCRECGAWRSQPFQADGCPVPTKHNSEPHKTCNGLGWVPNVTWDNVMAWMLALNSSGVVVLYEYGCNWQARPFGAVFAKNEGNPFRALLLAAIAGAETMQE